jgi:hypothetical protein
MQVLDNELLLQPAEADVVRGLLALNMAQDLFESAIATKPNLFGDTIGTVAITSGSESTAYPATLLRLDKLWMIDPATSRPIYYLSRLDRAGGQGGYLRWPLSLSVGGGRVRAYWEDGRNIYWAPFPSQSDTVRWYGFTPATDITAGGTFLYPDIAMMPIAAFAVKLMRAGVGDDAVDLDSAVGAFTPVVETLSRHNRDQAPGFNYTRFHTS